MDILFKKIFLIKNVTRQSSHQLVLRKNTYPMVVPGLIYNVTMKCIKKHCPRVIYVIFCLFVLDAFNKRKKYCNNIVLFSVVLLILIQKSVQFEVKRGKNNLNLYFVTRIYKPIHHEY